MLTKFEVTFPDESIHMCLLLNGVIVARVPDELGANFSLIDDIANQLSTATNQAVNTVDKHVNGDPETFSFDEMLESVHLSCNQNMGNGLPIPEQVDYQELTISRRNIVRMLTTELYRENASKLINSNRSS